MIYPLLYQRFLFALAIDTLEFYASMNPLTRRNTPKASVNVVSLSAVKAKRSREREDMRKVIETAMAVAIYGEERARAYILGESAPAGNDGRARRTGDRRQKRNKRKGDGAKRHDD